MSKKVKEKKVKRRKVKGTDTGAREHEAKLLMKVTYSALVSK